MQLIHGRSLKAPHRLNDHSVPVKCSKNGARYEHEINKKDEKVDVKLRLFRTGVARGRRW